MLLVWSRNTNIQNECFAHKEKESRAMRCVYCVFMARMVHGTGMYRMKNQGLIGKCSVATVREQSVIFMTLVGSSRQTCVRVCVYV